MLKPSQLSFITWLLINFGLLVGVPIYAYFELQKEVAEGHRAGTITSNGDSIAIPLMGVIMVIAIVALVFNAVWLTFNLLLRRKADKQSV